MNDTSGGGDTDMKDESEAALYSEYGEDPELAFAIKMSMLEEEAKKLVVPDEPDAANTDPSQIITLQLRMPDGSKLMRKFLFENTVEHVTNFVKKTLNKPTSTVKLSLTFPKKVLEDANLSLKESKLSKNETLIVEIK